MSNRTPLYDWHAAHQARMVPFGGWDMPVQYAGIAAEHKAVRSAVGLFDISHMARLRILGMDALALLELVFTNSVITMKDGQVRYGLVCNEAGGILDDILVTRFEDAFGVCVNAGNREKIVAWLNRHAVGKAVTIHDDTLATTMIAVQGPKAVAAMSGLLGDDVTAMKYYCAGRSSYRGQPCIVSRTGYTGEDGYELIVANDMGVTLWDDLVGRGAVPCGLGARDTLRLEAAMPLYGHELNETITPLQAGLGWAVKLDKGEFLGRTALKTLPVTTQRIGLALEGKRAAREGSSVLAGETVVGAVTSGSFVPGLDRSIAMAYVAKEFAAVGTPLNLDVRGSTLPATVVPMPFYKRPKE